MSTTDTLPPETPAEAESGGVVVLQRLVRGHLAVPLYLGDSLEIAPSLKGVDAIISDPPYGIGFQHSGGGNGKGKGRWLAKTCTIHGDDSALDPAPWPENS